MESSDIYAPVCWHRVREKIQTPQMRRQSFSKSNCQRAHWYRPTQTATHPAKLIVWNQTQTNWGTWGTHTNRSRLSSLSCDPLQPAITLQIRSYSRGIVLCQQTPSPSIPPVPAAPCNNKPPCSHATRPERLTGARRYKTLSFAHQPNTSRRHESIINSDQLKRVALTTYSFRHSFPARSSLEKKKSQWKSESLRIVNRSSFETASISCFYVWMWGR